MELDKLKQLCEEWQEILRLRDWEIALKMVHLSEMSGIGECGDIDVFPEMRQAAIRLVFPEELAKTEMPVYCLERTLLHELLHIYFAPFDTPDDTPLRVAEEQAVHALTEAMWCLVDEEEDEPV